MKKATKKKTKKRKTSLRKVTDKMDIVELILRDHKPLKKLIKTLKNPDAKLPAVYQAFEEFAPLLLNHADPEEHALYTELRERDSKIRTEGFEGVVEHHIADQLLSEINATTEEDKWRARVKVLAELVEHHIEEEEEDLLPDVRREFSLEERVQIGEEYSRLYESFSATNQAAA